MNNYVFKKISTQENASLRLYVAILKNSVEIILFQDENAWKSTVKEKDLDYFAQQYKETKENYCLKILDYVKNEYPNIIYVFDEQEFIINRSLENSLTVKFFSCKVKTVDYVNHVEQVMDKLSSDNTKLHDDFVILELQKGELEKNNIECESTLKVLTKQKINDENELYGRFVLILNEKKRRIQHLTELLEALKDGRPRITSGVKLAKNKKRKKDAKNPLPSQKKETISESEASDNDAYRTDSDNSSSEQKGNSTNEESKPSTSTDNFDFLDDLDQTHLLPKRIKRLPEENEVVVAPVVPKSPPKVEEVESTKRAKSPDIDLSTQQLLDML